jgi:hypothetical protein
MRIFKIKHFDVWSRRIKLCDATLNQAIKELEQGLYEANLGGHLYKKRVALGGRGKSSGCRTIIAYKKDDRSIFIYGYTKNQKANVTLVELEALKKLGKTYFGFTNDQITKLIKLKVLIEVNDDEKKYS